MARYIKMQLMVLLCGGRADLLDRLLALGLEQPDVMDDSYVGLIITVADVLVALIDQLRGKDRCHERGANGVECWRSPKSPGSAVGTDGLINRAGRVGYCISGPGILRSTRKTGSSPSVTRLGNLRLENW